MKKGEKKVQVTADGLKKDAEKLFDILKLKTKTLKYKSGHDKKVDVGDMITDVFEMAKKYLPSARTQKIKPDESEKCLKIYKKIHSYFIALSLDLIKSDAEELCKSVNTDLAFRLFMLNHHMFPNEITDVVLENIRKPSEVDEQIKKFT